MRDLCASVSERTSTSVTLELQLAAQTQQLDLCKRRSAEAEAAYENIVGELSELRQQKAQAVAEAMEKLAAMSAEKAELQAQLRTSREGEAALRSRLDALSAELRSVAGERATEVHTLELKLKETERLCDLYKANSEQDEARARRLANELSEREASLFEGEREWRRLEQELRSELSQLEARCKAAESTALSIEATHLGEDALLNDAQRAHLLLQKIAPEAAEGAPLIEGAGRAQLYAKYQETAEQLAAMRAEKENMSETLQSVLADLDAKLPRIVEQRRQLQELSQAHAEQAAKLEAAMREGELATARATELEERLAKREEQANPLCTTFVASIPHFHRC